jgi:hydrogenase maturation protease
MKLEMRRVVLGLGNTLNRDEGLGVHAATRLAEQMGEERLTDLDVEIIDGGTLGLNLLPIVEEASHLLLLDAADTGHAPGTVIELGGEEIPLFSGVRLSQHQVTFQEVLALASFRGKLPAHLHLIAVQPDDINLGVELSPTIEAVMPEVLTQAEACVARW